MDEPQATLYVYMHEARCAQLATHSVRAHIASNQPQYILYCVQLWMRALPPYVMSDDHTLRVAMTSLHIEMMSLCCCVQVE